MHVQGAGAEVEEAEAGGAGAEAEAPEYRSDLDSQDERDSESHTESSPQLGDREGMCEHHSGYGSHGCRVELEGSEVVCDLCEELDAFGRCDCDCDQCTERNNWVTDVLEAFSMVEQREMTPRDWIRLSEEEKAAYREFKEDADSEAAQTEGLPRADGGRAVRFMAKESLREMQMPDEGDCAFEAVCAMLPRNSEWSPETLREAVVDELLRDGVISLEYASVMRKAGTWATDVEMMRAAQIVRRLIVVVVMRPRMTPGGVEQEVVQEFEPAVHDARMVVVSRPGHFNATAVREWKLNERGRKTLRKITGIVVYAGLKAAARLGLSQWRQRMDHEQSGGGRLMVYR